MEELLISLVFPWIVSLLLFLTVFIFLYKLTNILRTFLTFLVLRK